MFDLRRARLLRLGVVGAQLTTVACAGHLYTGAAIALDAAEDTPVDASREDEPYGAGFQGDAGQCANVVCSGAQVCCVVPLTLDGGAPSSSNRCDDGCTAVCMDVCPPVAIAGAVNGLPPPAEGVAHGGGVRVFGADSGD